MGYRVAGLTSASELKVRQAKFFGSSWCKSSVQ